MQETADREHDRMLTYLWRHPEVLGKSLHLPNVWIVMREYVLGPDTSERADLVFKDRFEPRNVTGEATCFVLELKSGKADHEVLGQIQKAVNHLTKKGKSTGHWKEVRGVCVAKTYTESAKQLLKDAGFTACVWVESDRGIRLEVLS